MKLHWSPRSPFVRKVMIVAHETGLADDIVLIRSVAVASAPNGAIMADNPLNKIPTLVLDDGTPVFDSRVICEYLDGLHAGEKLFPAAARPRLLALRRQALGDGLMDLCVLWRGERNRPQSAQSADLLAAFAVKSAAALDVLEKEAGALAQDVFSIGHVAIGCALAYLDFRFADLDWRRGRPALADWHGGFEQRPSAAATRIVEG